jgi:hypothetical protein
VNPSDVGFHDRVVIQELIKTVAQTHQLDPSGQREFKGRKTICNKYLTRCRASEKFDPSIMPQKGLRRI